MTIRDTVLGAVRAALGSDRANPAAIAAEAQALLEDLDAIRPVLHSADLAEAFAMQATSPKVGATLDRLGAMTDVPGALARYLTGHDLPLVLSLQCEPALRALDWTRFEVRDTARSDEVAGLGKAKWGISETGSLVFHSGPDTAVLGHFLPLHCTTSPCSMRRTYCRISKTTRPGQASRRVTPI